MKAIALSVLFSLIVVALAAAAVPPIEVTVRDPGGKTAYKGATDGKGVFASGTLKAGEYVVQFNSKSAPKTSRYALIASAGKEKVVANGIAGEKLIVGVAVTIKVGPGLNVTGQVTPEDQNSARIGRNGKLMVWIPKVVGSNLPAHWAESDSAEAKQLESSSSYSIKNMQNKMNQGVSPMNDGGKMQGGAR